MVAVAVAGVVDMDLVGVAVVVVVVAVVENRDCVVVAAAVVVVCRVAVRIVVDDADGDAFVVWAEHSPDLRQCILPASYYSHTGYYCCYCYCWCMGSMAGDGSDSMHCYGCCADNSSHSRVVNDDDEWMNE